MNIKRDEETIFKQNTRSQDGVNTIKWTMIKNYSLQKLKTENRNLRSIVDEIRDRYRELDTRSWDMENGLNHKVEELELSVKDLDNKLKVSEECRELLESENKTMKNKLEDIKKNQKLDMYDTIQHLERIKSRKRLRLKTTILKKKLIMISVLTLNLIKTKNWFQLIVLSVIKRYSVLRTRARYSITGSPTTANVFARYVTHPFDLTYPGHSNYFGIHLHNKHTLPSQSTFFNLWLHSINLHV